MAKLYKSVWGCLKPVWRCCGHIGGLKLHVCYCPTSPTLRAVVVVIVW